MKPAPFEYVAPDSLESALELVARHGSDAKLLAGGQSLIPLLNFRLARPAILIDLNRLDDLDFVRPSAAGGLSIGAMTRQSRLEREPLVGQRAPLLAAAIPFVAHPQIRNRGTIGGTLAHADPAAELPAVAVALGARLRLRSRTGERWVDAESFFVGLLSTALAPDEILVEIEIPAPSPSPGWSFLEFSRRHGDYALTGIAAQVVLDDAHRCSEARLVYLSVGDGPVLPSRACQTLVGEELRDRQIDEVAELIASQEIDPSGDIHASADFKRHLCRVLTRRALEQCRQRARP